MGGFCPETNYLFMGMLPFFFLSFFPYVNAAVPNPPSSRAVILYPPNNLLIPHFF